MLPSRSASADTARTPPTTSSSTSMAIAEDKANLLIAMLGHIGVRAYPALVGTRDDIEADPAAPTLTSFDHVIASLSLSPLGAANPR